MAAGELVRPQGIADKPVGPPGPADMSQLISETAAWVAGLRAAESRRPDRHFDDPYAHLFVSPDLATWADRNEVGSGVVVQRTVAFDEIIMQTVADDAIDLVLNLAAGYDTRAYRLPLPPALRWVEVDLGAVLARKQATLSSIAPRCDLSYVALDLSQETEREALLARIGQEATRALVVTEGFLNYLEEAQVISLTTALFRQSSFQYWLTGTMSPRTRDGMNRNARRELKAAGTSMRFAPELGPKWFEAFGWEPIVTREAAAEMTRLRRGPDEQTLRRLAERAGLGPEERLGFNGTVLLRRRNAAAG